MLDRGTQSRRDSSLQFCWTPIGFPVGEHAAHRSHGRKCYGASIVNFLSLPVCWRRCRTPARFCFRLPQLLIQRSMPAKKVVQYQGASRESGRRPRVRLTPGESRHQTRAEVYVGEPVTPIHVKVGERLRSPEIPELPGRDAWASPQMGVSGWVQPTARKALLPGGLHPPYRRPTRRFWDDAAATTMAGSPEK